MSETAPSLAPGLSMNTRVRLSAMMFLQYAVHAVWIVPLAAYLGGKELGFTGSQISMVANAAPWGCLLAPIFVGMIADRFFASERVLAVLNFVGAALLVWASTITSPLMLFGVLLVQQLCYMPTWAITNSIAIAHCTDTEKDLPSIRVFGSIGWVATALFGVVAAAVGKAWDGTNLPLIAAAVLSTLAGLFAFSLPHTPPPAAGKKSSIADVLGLKALALVRNASFGVFVVVSLVGTVAFAAYWTFFSLYLANLGVKVIAGTMHLGQVIEIFVMWLLLPIALKRIGVKWTLVLGVVGLALRYGCFMLGNGEELMFLNYFGILVHGFIFSFFYVTGYVYVDRVAPKEIRAQGQALVVLVTFGAGMLLGNWINGKIVDANAILGEPVAQTYKMPAAIPAAPTLAVQGAKASDTAIYSRALSDNEITLLVAEQQKKDKLVERLRQEFGTAVDLAKGKVLAPVTAEGLTFATWLELPKDAKEPSGAIFQIGAGDAAMQLGLDKGRLMLQAGQARLTQTIPLPTGEKVHVAGTFDGKTLKLYSEGALFKRWHWRTVWTYPAVISAILVVLMLVFFHVKPAAKAEQAPPAAKAPVQEAPGEAPGEAEEADADEEKE